MDTEKILTEAICDGIREGVKSKLTGYNSPLDVMISDALKRHDQVFRDMLYKAVADAVSEKTFREQIAEAVRHKLAQTLIQRFGGELEKQVNVLKSDPMTRARITLAIEEIVKERCIKT